MASRLRRGPEVRRSREDTVQGTVRLAVRQVEDMTVVEDRQVAEGNSAVDGNSAVEDNPAVDRKAAVDMHHIRAQVPAQPVAHNLAVAVGCILVEAVPDMA